WFPFEDATRLFAFVAGDDGHLWAHVWIGRDYPPPRINDLGRWDDHGTPGGVVVASSASAVVCQHQEQWQLYAFVRGEAHHLYVTFFDAGNGAFTWRDLGQPPKAAVRGDPSAVVCDFPDTDPLYVFVRGSDDQLYMCHMDSGVVNPQWVGLSEE